MIPHFQQFSNKLEKESKTLHAVHCTLYFNTVSWAIISTFDSLLRNPHFRHLENKLKSNLPKEHIAQTQPYKFPSRDNQTAKVLT